MWTLRSERRTGLAGGFSGEKKSISLRALVNNESVGLFVGGSSLRMDDILVLHLENGKDFFVGHRAGRRAASVPTHDGSPRTLTRA